MSRPPPEFANEAALLLLESSKTRPFDLVVDLGSGPEAEHSLWFMDEGVAKYAIAVDLQPSTAEPRERFAHVVGDVRNGISYKTQLQNFANGVIWASHCLEHLDAPVQGLESMANLALNLVDRSVIAITVPPLKPQIVGGHLNLYNAGLLLYQMVRAGIDCSDARIKTYGYNISVIVPFERRVELPELRHDQGDIETLSHLFPAPFNHQGFNGEIHEHNWRPL